MTSVCPLHILLLARVRIWPASCVLAPLTCRAKTAKTIIEVPQFFLEEFISFYPDAKFILTERDMDAWTKSMNNTVVPVFQSMHAFPMNVIGLIDSFMDAVVKFHVTTEEIMFHGKGAGSAEGMRLCQEDTRKM